MQKKHKVKRLFLDIFVPSCVILPQEEWAGLMNVLFLQPGDFLRIYNLRAIPGTQKVPGLPSSLPAELHHLAFHLHGGTAYGRGLRLLPENSPDVQELKRYGKSWSSL